MSEKSNDNKNIWSRNYTIREAFAIIIFTFFILFFIIDMLGARPLVSDALLTGWFRYPMYVFSQAEVDPVGCVQAVVTVLILIVVMHLFFRWIYKAVQRDASEDLAPKMRRWRLHWTLIGVSAVTLLFITGMAFSGLILQIKSICESDQPLVHRSSYSRYNLAMFGRAILMYEDANGTLPRGTLGDEIGRQQHGWLIQLMPCMERSDIYDRYDFNRSWDDPPNAELMKAEIPFFTNSSLTNGRSTGDEGYGMIHFAANSRVIGPGPAMSLDDITDGHSTTMLVGEVNHDFLPWGHPQNYRDPAIGLNVPGGFGGSKRYKTNFLFCDGSARGISNDIDPAVLKALATPNAGDKPGKSSDW